MEATNRGAGPPGIAFDNMGRAHCLVEAVLLEFLRGQNIRNDAKIAVAFSGGPDSTALLTALCAIGWKRPIAVHVDHGIRDYDELSAERKLVESVCSSLGARLIQAHVRPGAVFQRSRVTCEGVEAEAGAACADDDDFGWKHKQDSSWKIFCPIRHAWAGSDMF